MMWTVIYIAPSDQTAQLICEKLTAEGFLVRVKPTGGMKPQYQILVPQGETQDVQDVLHEILQH
jgi:hypothetical protein